MKFEAYVILQAEHLEWKGGMKGDGNDPAYGRFYQDKDVARQWLKSLIVTINHEQSIGWRTANNLNPKESLDFLIQKVVVDLPTEGMTARGWKLNPLKKDDANEKVRRM